MRNAILAFLLGAFVLGLAHADDKAEFNKRFKKLKKKKEALHDHVELLQWCMEKGMFAEAVKVGEQAAKIDRSDKHIQEMLKGAKQELKRSKGGGGGGPPGGHGSGGKPPMGGGGASGDPGLKPKTPQDLGGDGNRIRQYVDQVFAWGNKLWDEGKKDRAKKYWNIIRKHYSGAKQQLEIIDAKIAHDKAPKTKGNKKGRGDGFKSPLEWDDDEDEEEKPKKGGKKGAGGDGDNVGEAPKGGKKGGDDDDNVGEAPVKPEMTGKEPKKKGEKKDDEEDEGPDQDVVDKKRIAESKKHSKKFEIKSFRVGSNVTFGGTYPQLELVFKNYSKPKYITLVFYGYSRKNKVFRSERTFLGPEVNKRHAIVTAYKKEWIREHGRLVAGRVEFWYGPRKEKYLMLFTETDKKRKYTKNADWYKPGIDDPTDRLGFYRPKQNTFESNTLKRIKRKFWESR